MSTLATRDSQLFEAGIIFLGNLVLCIAFFPPDVQGYGDAVRGWDQFNALLANGEPFFGPSNQIALRLMMSVATLVLLWLLVLLGLIERRVLITYLALPVSAYLATKIRMEFVFFPLALISTRLGWKREVIVILALLTLSFGLDERNGLILVVFRIGVLTFRIFRPRTLIILAMIGLIVVMDRNVHLLVPYIPRLAVYSWTRDIVNPEFSYFETLIVFLASMTMSLQPPADYMFGLVYSVFLLFATFGTRLFMLGSYIESLRRPEVRSGLLSVMLFTSLTHAFQNSRYYFFYVPIIASAQSPAAHRLLVLTSWPMTLLLVLYYRIVLGM